MTGLKQRLQDDLSTAMRAKDSLTMATLRMALSSVRNAEVAGTEAVTLTDEQVVAVLVTESRKRAESAEAYDQAGRRELADRERAEQEVLARYLPKALDDDELAAIVAGEVAKAASAGAVGMKAMGQVVKAVRERTGAAADGARIAALVKSALS